MNTPIPYEQLDTLALSAHVLSSPVNRPGLWINRGAFGLGQYSLEPLYEAMLPSGTGKIYSIMSMFTSEGIQRSHGGALRNAKTGSNVVLDEFIKYHDDYLIRRLGGLPINFIRSVAELQTISSNSRNQVPHTDGSPENKNLFALQAFPDNTESLADAVNFEGSTNDIFVDKLNNLRSDLSIDVEDKFVQHGDQTIVLGYHSTIHREPRHVASLIGQARLLVRTSIRIQ